MTGVGAPAGKVQPDAHRSPYAGVKVRRFGRSARGPRAEATRPSSRTEAGMSATVNVTVS